MERRDAFVLQSVNRTSCRTGAHRSASVLQAPNYHLSSKCYYAIESVKRPASAVDSLTAATNEAFVFLMALVTATLLVAIGGNVVHSKRRLEMCCRQSGAEAPSRDSTGRARQAQGAAGCTITFQLVAMIPSGLGTAHRPAWQIQCHHNNERRETSSAQARNVTHDQAYASPARASPEEGSGGAGSATARTQLATHSWDVKPTS